MPTPLDPCVIECVELACRREIATVHARLKRPVASLASISSTAPLIGILGTVFEIGRSFVSLGTSKSAALAALTGHLSESLFPTLLGLLVAIFAFWGHRYFTTCLQSFEFQMKNASNELINCLVLHLRRTGQKGPILFGFPKRRHESGHNLSWRTGSIETPRMTIEPIYRHGILELLWPRVCTGLDAESALQRGMWTAFVYAFVGLLSYLGQGRPYSGAIVAAFFALAGLALEAGSAYGITAILLFFGLTWSASLISLGPTIATFCLPLAVVPLSGSFIAIEFATRDKISTRLRERWTTLSPWPTLALVTLGFFACVCVLLGTVMNLLAPTADTSMRPAINPSDFIVIINPPLMGTISRGEVVEFQSPIWGTLAIGRVVGFPGDRIQVKSGKLIRNGSLAFEPYCRKHYFEVENGDFPLSSYHYLGVLLSVHENAYGQSLRDGAPFEVPTGRYFVLNDNRDDLWDSRLFGPIPETTIKGRPVLSFNFVEGLPLRLIR